jgi:large subunit ribosomal protein L15
VGASASAEASPARAARPPAAAPRARLDEVNPEVLRERGLVHKKGLVKVLGRGQIDRAVTVRAHAFSRSAEAAITAAGGTVEVLPLPWGDRRPPAKGNQHTNR